MTALYIILGIILFFIILFSIPVVLDMKYTDKFYLSISWLFIKFRLLPHEEKEKKPKKEKPPKEEKKPAEPEAQPASEEANTKPDNFIKVFYNNQGVTGIVELVKNCASYLGKFGKGFLKSIYIKKLEIAINVSESDAASTAIKYGKICQEIYPPLGFICSSCHVKNYHVDIRADYCDKKTKGAFDTRVALVPRSVINAGIALVFRLGIELIKVLLSNKKANKENNINLKGGQEQ